MLAKDLNVEILTPVELRTRFSQVKNLFGFDEAEATLTINYDLIYDKYIAAMNRVSELERSGATVTQPKQKPRLVNEYNFTNYVLPEVKKKLKPHLKHLTSAMLSSGNFESWANHEGIIDKTNRQLTHYGEHTYKCSVLHKGIKGIKYSEVVVEAYCKELLKDLDTKKLVF